MSAENDVQIQTQTQEGDSLATILTEIRRSEVRMDARLKKLEAEVQRSQDQAVERATKRARREKSYKFKKQGHRIQHEFNESVADCIERAAEEITRQPSDESALAKAKEALDEGLDLLVNRQKLIKIADRSDYGWSVVQEYEADDLASGSEDEKRLEKAERAAERKAAKKRKTAGGPAGKTAYSRAFKSPSNAQPNVTTRFNAGMPNHQAPGRLQMPLARPPPMVGPCFICGEMGHLRKTCAKAVLGQGRWYPGDMVAVGNTEGCVEFVSDKCNTGDAHVSVCAVKECGECSSSSSMLRSDSQMNGRSDVKEGVKCDTVRKVSIVIPEDTLPNSVNSEKRAVKAVSYQCIVGEVSTKEGEDHQCSSMCGRKNACPENVATEVSRNERMSEEGDSLAEVHVEEVTNQQDWEYEACTSTVSASVKGRLAKHVDFWKQEVHPSPQILRVIQEGYVIPFLEQPVAFSRPNQSSALNNAGFVQQALDELLADGRIKEVDAQPKVCSPLSVVVSSSGKKRLVLNLRHINKFVHKQSFKYEDLRTAMLLFEKGDHAFVFDLKSGYHHVDISPTQWTYLGFAWNQTGRKRFFVFTVLPFGLSTACYIFTKLLRPLVRYWRSKGIKIVVYIDDAIGAAKGTERAQRASMFVRSTLRRAGFIDHPEKCQWNPSAHFRWLGYDLDLDKGLVSVPEEKIEALQVKLESLAKTKFVCAKQLASITGTLISMGIGIGPISRLMTRSLYALVEARQSWYGMMGLTEQAREEIVFWLTSLQVYNSQPIWHQPAAVRVVYSDASDTGYGGYTVEHGPLIAHGQWAQEDAIQSSTFRELKAVRLVLESIADKLQSARLRWFSDNQNVVRILEVGSRKPNLQEQALSIFKLCVQYQIHIEPSWTPREENECADYISRIIDYDDWQLNPAMFGMLDEKFGPHTVDRFASAYNAQLYRFNSRYWSPGSEAMDAFTVNWRGENNWICPPVGLILRVLRHAQACKAEGTIIVPHWESAPFWPILCPSGNGFDTFVVEWCDLPLMETLFLPGRSGSVLFGGDVPSTRVLALRVCFQ